MRRRDRAGNAGLVVVSVLVAFGIGEVYCRVAGLGPGFFEISVDGYRLSENPRLLYEPRPGVGRYNSEGYIGPVYPAPSGKRRVAFIGDSVTYGLEIPLEKTFVHLLEERFQEHFQVMSFAVPGYDFNQYVETLETKVLRFKPDIVIFGICFNDLQYNSTEYDEILAAKAARSRFMEAYGSSAGWLMKVPLRSQLYRFLRYALLERGSKSANDVPPVRFQELVSRLEKDRKVAEMKFFLLPVGFDWYPDSYLLMRKELAGAGFLVRDLNSELRSDPANRPMSRYFKDGVHLNEKGHELVFHALSTVFDRLRPH